MIYRIILVFVLLGATCSVVASGDRVIIGTYSSEKMFQIKSLTFPRVLLYDQSGVLIDKEKWPKELMELAKNSGESYCCVSDGVSSDGEPPKDCKRITYGEDIAAHFDGLMAIGTEKLIAREDLPKSKYLMVEYYAEWCAPCHGARKSLEKFLKTDAAKKYVALVVDFTKMQEAM